MNSGIILVLVFCAIAVGFILWVRMNDQNHQEKREDEKSQ
jgi:hypothetical protein